MLWLVDLDAKILVLVIKWLKLLMQEGWASSLLNFKRRLIQVLRFTKSASFSLIRFTFIPPLKIFNTLFGQVLINFTVKYRRFFNLSVTSKLTANLSILNLFRLEYPKTLSVDLFFRLLWFQLYFFLNHIYGLKHFLATIILYMSIRFTNFFK